MAYSCLKPFITKCLLGKTAHHFHLNFFLLNITFEEKANILFILVYLFYFLLETSFNFNAPSKNKYGATLRIINNISRTFFFLKKYYSNFLVSVYWPK